MDVHVREGLENVQGARYRVVISFTTEAGVLPPNQTANSSVSDPPNSQHPVVYHHDWAPASP